MTNKKKGEAHEVTNPFEEMIKRLDVAAKIMKLDEDVYQIVKKPSHMVYCSLPVKFVTRIQFVHVPKSPAVSMR